MVRLLIGLLLVAMAMPAVANDPDCSGTGRWPTRSALVHLKNAGIVEKVDSKKTRTIRIASEKIGNDLYRQVHHIVFTEVSGTTIDVITVNDVSSEECSMSGVQVFVVSKRLGSTE